jgi:xanthine dehydrogenase accessory factor
LKDIYRRITELLSSNSSGAVATVIDTTGSSPARLGQKMVVTPQGYDCGTVGGGSLEKKVIDECISAIEGGAVRKIRLDLSEKNPELGMSCGGSAELLIEPFNSNFRIHIIGAGHVGKALVKCLDDLDFSLFISDDRQDLVETVQGVNLKKVCTSDYTEYFKTRSFDKRDAFVIVTRGHSHDFECAAEALKTGAPFIGVIGSRKKIIKMFEKLRKLGFENSDFERIVSPIGLSIGADTPAEIGVSIAGQLIAWKKSYPYDEICDLSSRWRHKLLKGELPSKPGNHKTGCPA